MSGGNGNDRFVFGVDVVGSGDLITDFVHGGDKLVIDSAAFDVAQGQAMNLVVGADPQAIRGGPQFLFG